MDGDRKGVGMRVDRSSLRRRGILGDVFGQHGASLLEFAVVATVFGILGVTLFGRILYAQEYAEKIAMELTVSNIRAGLRAEVGALLVADRTSDIAGLAGANPVQWLEKLPENYLGEADGMPRTDVAGKWYFNSARRELVYTPRFRRQFRPGLGEEFVVRFKVEHVEVPLNGVTASEPGWVRLNEVGKHNWF